MGVVDNNLTYFLQKIIENIDGKNKTPMLITLSMSLLTWM